MEYSGSNASAAFNLCLETEKPTASSDPAFFYNIWTTQCNTVEYSDMIFKQTHRMSHNSLRELMKSLYRNNEYSNIVNGNIK